MQLRELLKRYKASAGVNRAVIFGACVILPVIMVVLVTALVLTSGGRWLAGSGRFLFQLSVRSLTTASRQRSRPWPWRT